MSTTIILYIILALVGSYVIGCLQPSYLLGKAIKHVDIRDYGSGNSGETVCYYGCPNSQKAGKLQTVRKNIQE